MKKTWLKLTALVIAAAMVVPVTLYAQEDKQKEKDKEVKEKKETRQVIVTMTGDKDEKTVIEVIGDKITVNGKPLEEYKDKNGDINVHLNKFKSMDFMARVPGMSGSWSINDSINSKFKYFFDESISRPMLGVTTEKIEQGAKINSITKGGAAEKVGLKEGDIITKIGGEKIEDADDLSSIIKKHKAGDNVEVVYLREGKEYKANAELTKWKGQTYKIDNGDMNLRTDTKARLFSPHDDKVFKAPGQTWAWSNGSPKLGLSVQDTDDGKGVKVIEVDEASTASKAGIKENDVITEVDGKAINTTDEMVKMIKESKEKISIMVKLQRGGKTQNIEVKMPRKIKTADL